MPGIDGIKGITLKADPLAGKLEKRDRGFAQRIKSAIEDVNTKQHIADESIEAVIKGEMGIHEGMMAIGKADTSLRLLTQVRSKIMAAYNEVMRMQI